MWSRLQPLAFLAIVQSAAHQDVCPPWFFPDNSSSTGCSCFLGSGEVSCFADLTLLQIGFCMTYDSSTESTSYGPCPYIMHLNIIPHDRLLFYQLPDNESLLKVGNMGTAISETKLMDKWAASKRTQVSAILCIKLLPLLENALKLNFKALYETENLDPLQGPNGRGLVFGALRRAARTK